jgi:hypothetical protein
MNTNWGGMGLAATYVAGDFSAYFFTTENGKVKMVRLFGRYGDFLSQSVFREIPEDRSLGSLTNLFTIENANPLYLAVREKDQDWKYVLIDYDRFELMKKLHILPLVFKDLRPLKDLQLKK